MTLTQNEIGQAFHNAGNYRVVQAQRVAAQGAPDGISGALLLALGLRETGLKNIEGGAKLVNGKWVALEGAADAHRMDVGAFQISRTYHFGTLAKLPAVLHDTWGPVVPGHSPAEWGFVPRYTDALRFTIGEMQEATAFAEDHGVQPSESVRFAVAAHNAGQRLEQL